ncbi:MAG TPA: DUF4097 family beta strand repeat protein [Clostridiaceae bacterium]|nr:DUF4097 family beta strand repeat protein [Clostridiaceae bacterium]
MSNSEERLLILKMLEEGKITSEEAARLLEALEGNAKQEQTENASKQQRQTGFYDEIYKMRDRINEWTRDFKKNYTNKDFDKMVDEFSAKAEKLGKNVAAATLGIVDRIVDYVGSFVDTNAFNIFGSYKTVDKSFETPAIDGMDFNVMAVNGHILVKKHHDNKIVIRSRVKSPHDNVDDIISFTDSDNAVSLTINKAGNISISHEIFLPAVKFKNIRLETTNGKILIEDSLSEYLECTTKNAPVEVTGANSGKMFINARNSRIQASYIISRNIQIDATSSVVDMKNIKAVDISAITMNGRILMENLQNHQDSSEINLVLKTTNGGIKVNMNDMDNKGYKIKALASNGDVNLLIPELMYHNVNKQRTGGNLVEAESNGYGNYAKKVNIYAEAINGYVEVVK